MKAKVVYFSQAIVLVCTFFLLIINTSCEQEIVTSDSQESNIKKGKSDLNTYLDIDPDILKKGISGDDTQYLEIFSKANARFYENVKLDKGILKYIGSNNINISDRLFNYLRTILEETNRNVENGMIVIIESDNESGFDLVSAKISIVHNIVKTRGAEGDSDYNKVDFTQKSPAIGLNVIAAMRQFFLNNVTNMYDLVNYGTTTWGQGGAIRSDYFAYNGKQVQWTVVNGYASTNYQRDIYSVCTSNCVSEPKYNNYEIQIRYCDGGTALRLKTDDYGTYKSLLDAVGY